MSQCCGPHLHPAWSSHPVVSCAISCSSDVFALEPGGRAAEMARFVPCQALSIAFYWRPSFHTSQSVGFSLHPFPLSLCSISHGWVTGRWPTGVCFAFLQTTFVLPHQHFSHICLASLGVLLFCLFFQKKQSTYRQAQKKRRKHLGWADQFAYPQEKWSTWLMPQKAMGPGDHPNMWIISLVVPSVWNWKGDQSKPSATTFSVRLQKEIHAACPEEHS